MFVARARAYTAEHPATAEQPGAGRPPAGNDPPASGPNGVAPADRARRGKTRVQP
jgi:hypothetical protein